MALGSTGSSTIVKMFTCGELGLSTGAKKGIGWCAVSCIEI